MQINNPTTFSPPDLTLTTANSSGNAGALRADDSILVYDTTLPDAITFGQSGATGSAATSARRDHSHAMASETAVPYATQAEMEAGSSTSVVVSPGRQQYHPGNGKAWAHWKTSHPTELQASYNITGLTDEGVGRTTVTFDTDFSGGDNYATAAMCSVNGATLCGAPAAGSIEIKTYSDAGSTLVDSDNNNIVIMGDF